MRILVVTAASGVAHRRRRARDAGVPVVGCVGQLSQRRRQIARWMRRRRARTRSRVRHVGTRAFVDPWVLRELERACAARECATNVMEPTLTLHGLWPSFSTPVDFGSRDGYWPQNCEKPSWYPTTCRGRSIGIGAAGTNG